MRTLDETGEQTYYGGKLTTEWKGSDLYIPCRHTHYEPEVLLAEEVLQTQIPCLSVRIIQVTKNGVNP
jgi:hypothetical protein